MDEFARIRTLLAPLSQAQPGAFNLTDDAACITPPPGQKLVITQDTLVEQVHFKGNEAPDQLAQKSLRVNVSDLAAKAAQPWLYFLSLSLTSACDDAWLKAFTQGLAADQAAYGLTLAGGDSTRQPSHTTISITALGLVPSERGMICRSGAQAKDHLFVTGTLGDAALGLHADSADEHAAFLRQRYALPQPRTAAISLLRKYATAALDISDGLVQDAGHLAHASNLTVEIELQDLPLSHAARIVAGDDRDARLTAATGGDDYEILFTAPAAHAPALMEQAASIGLAVTRIGEVTTSDVGVRLCYQGKDVPMPSRQGYRHGS